jgi:hypothetical protein
MKDRESWIPRRNSSVVGEPLAPPHDPKRRRWPRLLLPLLIIGVAAVLWLRDLPQGSLGPFLEPVRSFFGLEENGGQAPTDAPPLEVSPPTGVEAPQTLAVETGPDQPTGGEPKDFVVSIGIGFRPVGFQMAASRHQLALSTQPQTPLQHALSFSGPEQRYGVLGLGARSYAFVLDAAPGGYRLYLDRNGNRNLNDDGPPLVNRGKGRFANSVELPLPRVTGMPRLQGGYRLWLFTTPESWSKNRLNYYCMTQLQGQLQFQGKRYVAYLADNLQIDGDYTNDGISIDLDADGNIDLQREFFAPGEVAVVDGRGYRFQVVR